MRYQFMRFPGGLAKAVTFSYDDGCKQDIELAALLSNYGLKGTFNLNADVFRYPNTLSQEVIQEHFISKGHEIAIHGAFHRAEGSMRIIEGIQDVLTCRLELEHKYGVIVRGMAYPDTGITMFANGANYQSIKQYLIELDIAYARSLGADNNSFSMPNDWHNWVPTAHHDNPNIFDYVDTFVNMDLSPNTYAATRHPRLFYVWGHAYEFDNHNNWEHMHRLCQQLCNNKEIWYATNIEIFNYTSAYQSLIYSADGTIIYNPTLYTIWFDCDGRLYSISPGETLKI